MTGTRSRIGGRRWCCGFTFLRVTGSTRLMVPVGANELGKWPHLNERILRLAITPTIWLKLATVLLVFAASPASNAQVGADVGRGQEIAQRVCAGCHQMSSRVGGEYEGKYVPSFPEVARLPGRTADQLRAFILAPHRPMPGLPLTVREVEDIVAFIRSLHMAGQQNAQ